MTQTSHARSRWVSIYGLAVQAAAAVVIAMLAGFAESHALNEIFWFLVGGVPIWFAALLFFRQHELAELEDLDLEELRREKRASGGGELLFGEGDQAPLTMRTARLRLEWMQAYLLPGLSLVTAAYLIGVGVWRWGQINGTALLGQFEPLLQRADVTLVVLAIVLLALFFLSRYASGMARVEQWRLLRAGASYALGSAALLMAVSIAYGVFLYQGGLFWERLIAVATPVLMVVLGLEMAVNFVGDRYRPRVAGTEPRAAFDSRLLALISEPGGVASSVAEALNYQFGFRVSQTWFYQLLQRALIPLLGVGALALWLLTTIVIVWPNERAIIERFGRQINSENPLRPGLYFKLPAPFAFARTYDVEGVRQFFVGYRTGDQPADKHDASQRPVVELWSDQQHSGREHFDFLISLASTAGGAETRPADGDSGNRGAVSVPVNMVRLEAYVQYQIDEKRLSDYTRGAADPDQVIRLIAWQEISRYAAGSTIDELIGKDLGPAGAELAQRIQGRADELRLGLRVLRVGFPKVHPEQTVAVSFRRVVNAQLEKVAEIRKARVSESEVLSRVAGDRERALSLNAAVQRVRELEERRLRAESALPPAERRIADETVTPALTAAIRGYVEAQWSVERAQRTDDEMGGELELGLGRTAREREAAARTLAEARAALQAAEEQLTAAFDSLRGSLRGKLKPEQIDAKIDLIRSTVGLAAWNERLERELAALEGEAAVTLAQAQAARWRTELQAASDVTRVKNEREAFQVAPKVFKERRYLQMLTEHLPQSRKYFLAIDGDPNRVHVRVEAQEVGRPELQAMPTRPGQ